MGFCLRPGRASDENTGSRRWANSPPPEWDVRAALEQELQNSRKQETEFEEAMESLQQEIESLEQQNKQFVLNIEDGGFYLLIFIIFII